MKKAKSQSGKIHLMEDDEIIKGFEGVKTLCGLYIDVTCVYDMDDSTCTCKRCAKVEAALAGKDGEK